MKCDELTLAAPQKHIVSKKSVSYSKAVFLEPKSFCK
jgi:hypothetical protein